MQNIYPAFTRLLLCSPGWPEICGLPVYICVNSAISYACWPYKCILLQVTFNNLFECSSSDVVDLKTPDLPSPSPRPMYFFFFCFCLFCGGEGTRPCHIVAGDQRTVGGNCLSSFTVWVLEIQLSYQAWRQLLLPAEPPCPLPHLHLKF